MVLVGMLHYRNNPDTVRKAYPFAAVAKMEGLDFIYFTYHDVDFNKKIVKGLVYEQGIWLAKQTEIPAVIINSCNPKNNKQSMIMERLKRHAVFTSYPVGNKIKVYRKIKKAKTFAAYLIPSIVVNSENDLYSFLEKHSAAVLKPLSGNHGKRIYFINKINDMYKWTDGLNEQFYKKEELKALILQVIVKQKYLLQPFIECKTKSGLTYDFRLHVQKNGTGQWEKTLIYPRISGNSKKVSNISSGGYRGELDPFLKAEFGEDSLKMKQTLEEFALTFAAHFDSLYPNPFDELGIDIGVDQQQKLWIFEVNWRPGSNNREFEVGKRLIPYCRFLAAKKMKQ
ncbi:YheC/YheD family protein [Bacillus sp. FJAT-29814]|uniref:YheC/YheD family endospore coat-associated protein n=1 Tax=Bacillus sp. FJAT-29814 TaxID=1729688 RepID=UPI0008322B88|nr:YheC/YheD family protein [Bacillus sp. FJAT-29814]